MIRSGENIIDGVSVFVERKRTRRINLRINAEGEVHLSIPIYGGSYIQGESFLRSKWDWILKTRNKIFNHPKKSHLPITKDEQLLFSKNLDELCERWMDKLGEKNVIWKIRTFKTQWGSCNWKKRVLSFNLELARKSLDLVEYVVVHEFTHLKVPNHGPRFYSLMSERLTNWKLLRRKLNTFPEKEGEDKMEENKNARSVEEIISLASAYYGSAVLFAGIECGIFKEALNGFIPQTRGMKLLANACVAERLLEKRGDEFFTTPAAAMALVPGGKADLTKAIAYNKDVYPAWGKLTEFVQSGNPVERPEIHLGEDKDRTTRFAASMFGRAMGIGRGIIPMLGKLQGRILDLAGGPAAFAILMCQANEGLCIDTVDLSAISAEAEKYVAQFGLSDRITCKSGDYHSDEYPENCYDAVTIFGALHQESPENIVDILKRAYKALKQGGKVFVLDVMTDETHTRPYFSALFALNMALTTKNGWVFSDEELKGWMREANFQPLETVPSPKPMPHWLLVGVKGLNAQVFGQ